MIWALPWTALFLVRYAALFNRNRVRILMTLTGQLLIFGGLEKSLRDNAWFFGPDGARYCVGR